LFTQINYCLFTGVGRVPEFCAVVGMTQFGNVLGAATTLSGDFLIFGVGWFLSTELPLNTRLKMKEYK
jgi:hypothetical protein